MKSLFRTPMYPAFWASKALSDVASGMVFTLMAATMLSHFGASALALGIGINCLGAFVASPIVGVVADRYSRTTLMAASDVVGGLSLLGWAAVLAYPQPHWFFVLAVWGTVGVAGGMYDAPHRAAVPQIVQDTRTLETANSVETATSNTAQIVGAAVGGVLLALQWGTIGMVATLACYVVSALCVFLIRLPAIHRDSHTHPWADFVGGVRASWEVPWLRLTLLQGMAYFIAVYSILHVLIQEYLVTRFGEGAIGLYYAVRCIGAIVAAMLASWVMRVVPTRRTGVWASLSLGLWIAPVAAILTQAPLPLAGLAAGLAALGSGLYFTLWFTAVQKRLPGPLLGRIFSLQMTTRALGTLMGALTVPLLLGYLGATPALWIGAASTLFAAVVPLFFRGVPSLGNTDPSACDDELSDATVGPTSPPVPQLPSNTCPVHHHTSRCPVHQHAAKCPVHDARVNAGSDLQ